MVAVTYFVDLISFLFGGLCRDGDVTVHDAGVQGERALVLTHCMTTLTLFLAEWRSSLNKKRN